jgi:aminoglycoside N3'-acetyltransferase
MDRSLSSFKKVLSEISNENCFIYAGHKEIADFFLDKGGLDGLVKVLDENFENIIVPAYTLSFKQHGVYHQKFSKPDIGYFSVLFKDYATFRTEDPIASLWVRGSLNPNKIDLRKTFTSKSSLFGYMDSQNSITLNLGTKDVKLAHLHYLEEKFNLPYRKKVIYEGVAFFDEQKFTKIKQETTTNIGVLHFERERIEYELLKAGVLKRYDFGNLILRVMNNAEFSNFLEEKTKKNPYYLFFEKK